MQSIVETTASFLLGPLLFGIVILTFLYPMGQMVVTAKGHPFAQAVWLWVIGFVALVAIYGMTGRSLL